MGFFRKLSLAAVCTMALGGCSKPASTDAPSASAQATAATTATPTPTEIPTPTATTTAKPAPTPPSQKAPANQPASAPTAPAAPVVNNTPQPAPPGSKTFTCGDKTQPPCPTQKWMKENMAPAAASEDAAALARGLRYIETHAPPGMPNWESIAKTGAAKAAAGDVAAAKASCKSLPRPIQGALQGPVA